MMTDRKIDVEGVTLHTQRRGSRNGRSILFLHGGAGSLDDFDPVIEKFAAFDCVLMDTRGHGRSALGEAPLRYGRLAQDAEAVIDAYGLKKPLVIGHSDGGITGLLVAVRRCAPLSGLVTLAAHGSLPSSHVLENVYRPLTAQKWRERFPDWVALYDRLNPQPDFDRLFAALRQMWITDEPDNYPGALVKDIDCPTLVLGGDEDHLVLRMETVDLAASIPNAALGVYPFGSHVFHQEAPDLVVPHILRFIDGL